MATTVRSTVRSRAASSERFSRLPHALGAWEVVEELAEGELAHVYLARAAAARGERPACYALKVLRSTWTDDQRGVALLAREVQVSRSVQSPHVAPILAAELDEPPHYVVMPYLEGHSLANYLVADVRLDLPVKFWIARQTAAGLAALERAGWMHGDLKPSNLMVSPSGHTTIIDLGFATPTRARGSIADRPLLGTVSYMAPELLYSSYGGDSLSDVYSLGVVLFEMLTGHLPFDADDVAELALQHRQELPNDVRSLVPQVPMRAARLVQQMLSKEPLRRPTPSESVERLIALEIETFGERFACEAAEQSAPNPLVASDESAPTSAA